MTDLESVSDATLVLAIARWQEPPLAEAYRRHSGAVGSLARRVLGTADASEEITQEVLTTLWERPERFDSSRGSLRSFLLATAHSRAIDHLRSQSARTAREEREARMVASEGYDIEGHAWDLHLNNQVKRAVRALPETERQAIELAYFGGHTYREVGGLPGGAEETVKSRIRSGLGRLRNAVGSEGALT